MTTRMMLDVQTDDNHLFIAGKMYYLYIQGPSAKGMVK